MFFSSVAPRPSQLPPKPLGQLRIQGGSECYHYFHQYVSTWLTFSNRFVYACSFLFSSISVCTLHHLTTPVSSIMSHIYENTYEQTVYVCTQ